MEVYARLAVAVSRSRLRRFAKAWSRTCRRDSSVALRTLLFFQGNFQQNWGAWFGNAVRKRNPIETQRDEIPTLWLGRRLNPVAKRNYISNLSYPGWDVKTTGPTFVTRRQARIPSMDCPAAINHQHMTDDHIGQIARKE